MTHTAIRNRPTASGTRLGNRASLPIKADLSGSVVAGWWRGKAQGPAEPGQGLVSLCAVPGGIHHSVVAVRDLEASLRFYRDALGLDLLQDRQVEGDWPDLFGAPGRRVHAVFLGDAGVPDDHAGVLELNVFDGDVPEGPPPSPPRTGSSCCRFCRRRGHARQACRPRPRRSAAAHHSVDAARAGDPGDRARPRRAAYLAHPRFDYQERVTN